MYRLCCSAAWSEGRPVAAPLNDICLFPTVVCRSGAPFALTTLWSFSPTVGTVCHCLQVEKELTEICQSILQLLDEHLIPTASTGESKVFYLKMKGDYHRYLAEFKTGSDRKEAAEHTLLAYKAAQVR